MGAAAQTILGALAGGIQGGFQGYSWQKEQELAQQKLDQQRDIAELTQQVREMVARIQADSRSDVAGITAGSRERVAETNATSREKIAGEAETGRNLRKGLDEAFRRDQLTTTDATRRRGQDFSFEVGKERNTNTRRGQDLSFSLGQNRIATTQRGQDLSTDTTRRGQDIASGDRRFIAGEATKRAKMRADAGLFGPLDVPEPPVSTTLAPPSEEIGHEPYDVPPPAVGRTPISPAPVAPPVTPTTGTTPVQPRSPEGTTDLRAQLAQKVSATLQRFQAEKDPAKKAALAKELQRLREQIIQAKGKGR